jgi:hypothetical protein
VEGPRFAIPFYGLVVSLTFVVVGCSDDEPKSTTGRLIEGEIDQTIGCDELFGEGTILREDAFGNGCTDQNGEVHSYGVATLECEDGRTLYWNNQLGWGFVGEPWHTDHTDRLLDRTGCEH